MADIATALASWSATAASNQPDNSDSVGPNTLADNLRTIQAVVRDAVGGDGSIASATTTDLSTVNANYISVSGTTTITGLGTLSAGIIKVLRFEGALTFTHNGTSLILPGAANITTAAGDIAIMRSAGSGNWRCLAYMKASGFPIVEGRKETIYVPAAAMVSRTTSGAAAGATETSTNKVMIKTLDFDTASAEYAQFSIQMPKSWNEGTLTFRYVWSHAATTTNFGVAFGLQAVAFANDDAADTAFGTGVVVTDTGGTTDDVYISDESAAITVGNTPGASEWVVFQAYRSVSDGGDTMAIDARLHGIQLFYTADAYSDA